MIGSCHMTFTPKVTLLKFPPFLDANSAERGIYWKETLKRTLNGNLEWEPGEKLPNPMRKTGEENRKTI